MQKIHRLMMTRLIWLSSFRFFLTHKIKYILLGLIGLILGLVNTFQHEPRFETVFKVHIGHPALTHYFLIYSSHIQEQLNTSELNPHQLPSYSFDNKTEVFTIISEESETSEAVTQMITEAMENELIQLKEIASYFEGFDNKPVILNNNNNNNNYSNNLTWTNKDIAKLNQDQVLESLNLVLVSQKRSTLGH